MNRTTKEERQQLIDQAAQLLAQGKTLSQITGSLQRTAGVSRQRARHAAARAILRANRPKAKR